MKLKKLNLIIGKRQIVIVSLLVTLSVAAFLNWQFATGDQAITVNNSDNKTEEGNYGEAELVSENKLDIAKNTGQVKPSTPSTPSTPTTSFIRQAEIDNTKAYEKHLEELQQTQKISNNNLTTKDQEKISDRILSLTMNKQKVSELQSQVKSINFVKDCIIYLDWDHNLDKNSDKNKNTIKLKIYVEIEKNFKDTETNKNTQTTNSEELSPQQVSIIKDTIVDATGIAAQNITIVPVKNQNLE